MNVQRRHDIRQMKYEDMTLNPDHIFPSHFYVQIDMPFLTQQLFQRLF
jgi:hypothetical protein